ncbi:heavy metal translocating P-type ATPase [Armatimonas rosea]|uniref:Heavy metal translocating P-type ATPase n=1 Tax=Armatimonas rosea TaxID=685828 RepID=A0A7W9SS32_ARMRO|nr:heavy metal translocating P-type ATPase [Armatimonas rosea]MBB6051806.1 heavy metal translocating P-type ATPase [Armatimonas rosea]
MHEKTTRLQLGIALLALTGIALHLGLRFGFHAASLPTNLPLFAVLALGGTPLVWELLQKLARREFGSDLLAGISIVTSVLLGEYLAGALVVLMLSGGEALEAYATKSASSVLQALAKRMPTLAQRKVGEQLTEVPLAEVGVGDTLVVFPHALCPVDGTVLDGHGAMDESYLTGEPYQVSKAPGTTVLSGAINGESALTIRCDKPAQDSRYARIMQVMRDSEQNRPQLRRIADKLGAWYTPLAVGIALVAGLVTHDPLRFLAVMVIATPCPLLIAIPIAIIGSISLAARKGIIIKDPSVLENLSTCKVALFDKTGTLTYGKPRLTELLTVPGFDKDELLTLVASLERYSKHPLSSAILEAAEEKTLTLRDASEVRELPGDGLRAEISGRSVHVTSRKKLTTHYPDQAAALPEAVAGMECVVLVDNRYAGALRFRDEPRPEGAHFIQHLAPRHGIKRVLLVSGDRASEVSYLAEKVGITEVFASQSPEQKLELVRAETKKAPTVFMGDGINDAPALTAATVGIAFGNNSEITGEAADAVILDSSLEKVDVLMHIGQRMRRIALQSAVGGMVLSIVGMLLGAAGLLSPVTGAVAQEIIDVLAVLNALRAALPPKVLSDY